MCNTAGPEYSSPNACIFISLCSTEHYVNTASIGQNAQAHMPGPTQCSLGPRARMWRWIKTAMRRKRENAGSLDNVPQYGSYITKDSKYGRFFCSPTYRHNKYCQCRQEPPTQQTMQYCLSPKQHFNTNCMGIFRNKNKMGLKLFIFQQMIREKCIT